VSTSRTSISALQLQRETGIGSYETAWSLLHKVRRVLGEGDQYPLRREAIEVDESQVGGKGTGRGRKLGVGGAWILGAVERIEVNKPGKKPYKASGSARMDVVRDTGAETLEAFVDQAVERGSHVVTDGWPGSRNLDDHGYEHEIHVLRGNPPPASSTPHSRRCICSSRTSRPGSMARSMALLHATCGATCESTSTASADGGMASRPLVLSSVGS
jgi:hypothetical protein